MPRLSLWQPIKGNDFNFIDRVVGEHLFAGGTSVLVHKYLGVHDTPDTGDATRPSSGGGGTEVFIQDLLFLENRDRKYDKNIYELRGQYSISDGDAFDLTQFGLFLSNGTLLVNFHIESMVEALGRKLMPGDVIELPHQRDDLLLGSDDAINRFHVVTDGSRPSAGYDPGWWPHLWRVKLGPITDSQEYRDILGTGEVEGDLRTLISTYSDSIAINDAILAAAASEVPYAPQYRNTAHLYFDPEVPDKPVIDFGGQDGMPPNGVSLIGSGETFPVANEGDYFLRTDFSPNRLFKKTGTRWSNVGTDERGVWAAANRILTQFVNNPNTRIDDQTGQVVPEKTNLSKVVRPRTDN